MWDFLHLKQMGLAFLFRQPFDSKGCNQSFAVVPLS